MAHRILPMLCTLAVAAPAAGQSFTDVTDTAGIEFTHRPSVDHRSGPMSGGGAVADFNLDGYPDIYVIGSGDARDALFINQRDGRFIDQADEWGLGEPHRGTGAAVGDVDGDGDDDLFVTSFGPMDQLLPSAGQHRLYRNQGNRFVNIATEAGLDYSAAYPEGYGATFGDIDLDGDLDLFVAGWHDLASGQAHGSRLFRNLGQGQFDDVSERAGLLTTHTQAFGAAIVDLDGDRWPEIVVAGDFGTSRYLRNDRDGGFTALDPGTGLPPTGDPSAWSIDKAHNAMGLALADMDQDGRTDFLLTAIWPTFHFESGYFGNGLYLNQGNHRYVSAASATGVADGGWGWGVSAADFDHDGLVDLAMTNGWPFVDQVTGEAFADEQSYVFFQRPDGRFDEAALKSGLHHRQQGRALMTLDYDRDGDLDLVVLSNRGSLRLYRNDSVATALAGGTPANQNWLQVTLDTQQRADLAPHGLGANVFIEVGESTRYASVASSPSFLGASERLVHFGLGTAKQVDKLVIEWPDGARTTRCYVAANARILIAAPGRYTRGQQIDCADNDPLDSKTLRTGHKTNNTRAQLSRRLRPSRSPVQ